MAEDRHLYGYLAMQVSTQQTEGSSTSSRHQGSLILRAVHRKGGGDLIDKD